MIHVCMYMVKKKKETESKKKCGSYAPDVTDRASGIMPCWKFLYLGSKAAKLGGPPNQLEIKVWLCHSCSNLACATASNLGLPKSPEIEVQSFQGTNLSSNILPMQFQEPVKPNRPNHRWTISPQWYDCRCVILAAFLGPWVSAMGSWTGGMRFQWQRHWNIFQVQWLKQLS